MSKQEAHVDHIIDTPSFPLGPRASYSMLNDPKHLAFVLSRYKFCSKMLQGKKHVLELGCGDAFGSPLVAQVVERLFCIDREPRLIEGDRKRLANISNMEFHVIDMISEVPSAQFDAVFSIDVIEHFRPEDETVIMNNLMKILHEDAVAVIGTPNITAEQYASKPGASPHINLKSHVTLREMMTKYFKSVFLFSMNDEVLHTGFYPMAHYLWALGVGKKLS